MGSVLFLNNVNEHWRIKNAFFTFRYLTLVGNLFTRLWVLTVICLLNNLAFMNMNNYYTVISGPPFCTMEFVELPLASNISANYAGNDKISLILKGLVSS